MHIFGTWEETTADKAKMFTRHPDRDLSWNTFFFHQLGQNDVIQGPAVLTTVPKGGSQWWE